MTVPSTRDGATRATGPHGAGSAKRLAILLGLVAVAVFAASIAAFVVGGPGRQIETGIVVEVQATGITSVQGFSIRTPDGRTIDFRIPAGALETESSFPPGHLAEHRVTLEPVRVTYVRASGANQAVRIEDAP
jgi:hypothetical protein